METKNTAIPEEAAALLGQVETTPTAPPGASPEAGAKPPQKVPNAAIMKPAVGLLCKVASRIVPQTPISAEEEGALVEAYVAVLDIYYPDGIEFGPWIGAAIVTAGVFGPRIAEYKISQAEAAAKKAANDAKPAAA